MSAWSDKKLRRMVQKAHAWRGGGEAYRSVASTEPTTKSCGCCSCGYRCRYHKETSLRWRGVS